MFLQKTKYLPGKSVKMHEKTERSSGVFTAASSQGELYEKHFNHQTKMKVFLRGCLISLGEMISGGSKRGRPFDFS